MSDKTELPDHLNYRVTIHGNLQLSKRKTVSGEGRTEEPSVIKDLTALAEIKTGLGKTAYVEVWTDDKGSKAADQGGEPSTPERTDKLPEGVDLKTVVQVEGYLTAQDHTWASANLLSDAELDKLQHIAEGRIKVIRAYGVANGLPAYTPPAE
jgi:hypothetical protein